MDLFCESHMSIQHTAMSDFKNALIIWSFETRMTLLKMCISLITSLIKLEAIGRLVFYNMYGRPEIFRYDLDLEMLELLIWF